jgi:hypothetical protein
MRHSGFMGTSNLSILKETLQLVMPQDKLNLPQLEVFIRVEWVEYTREGQYQNHWKMVMIAHF